MMLLDVSRDYSNERELIMLHGLGSGLKKLNANLIESFSDFLYGCDRDLQRI